MEASYCNKQIIWAKVKGYPWWPAEIVKLPTPEIHVFKVIFIAEENHAYLHPKDVRKYAQYYEEFSKKKMRGLAPAIEAADQLTKKRLELHPKRSGVCKGKQRRGKKSSYRSRQIQKSSSEASESSSHQQEEMESQVKQKAPLRKKGQKTESKEVESKLKKAASQEICEEKQEQKELQEQPEYSSQNLGEEKFLNESEEKVDRSKIQSIEESLYRILEDIRQNQYTFSLETIQQMPFSALSDEELLQSKITNMLNFIIIHLKKQYDIPKPKFSREAAFVGELQGLKELVGLQKGLKERILNYLKDTTYYDQFVKLIQRNKKNRSEYECKLIMFLKRNYKIKKQLSIIFANRLISQINNGTIINDKELLEDIRESRVQIGVVNNKAAIERHIEIIIPKYM